MKLGFQEAIDSIFRLGREARSIISTEFHSKSAKLFCASIGPSLTKCSVYRANMLSMEYSRDPDFSAYPHGAQLEQLERVFSAMVSSGFNAWLPSSTKVILPVGKTHYTFEKLPSGYKVTMNGENVAGTLLPGPDLRVTSGAMQLPQAMRFSTDFESGPQGFVLSSVKTGRTPDTTSGSEATFAYTYQTVDGIQIPDLVTVNPATTGKWHYRLADCKAVKFVKVQALPRN